jgi:2-haloacid dehalogenase
MTTPEKFIRTRTTIPAGVELLHELKTNGYKVYVLSNWDPTSFPLLKAKYPEIFTYNGNEMFNGIMISGNVGMLKPDPAIFAKFLTDFNIQASNAIFIDDTIENVQAAKKIEISSIHCESNNIPAARKKLIEILNN